MIHYPDRRGSKNSNAKLTDSDVVEVKRLLSEGYSERQIAPLFRVSRTTIGNIKRGKRG